MTRSIEFAPEEFYHIYNRGVDKREVFLDEADYIRFLTSMREFNSILDREERLRKLEKEKSESNSDSELDSDFSASTEQKLVEIICYCLNPNHYHFILRQLQKNGISRFMQKVGTGYTNYFNKKQNRSGALFQGKFKSIHIDSNDYLLYLSAYVNANNFIHGFNEKLEDWAYSSYLDYAGQRAGKLSKKEVILGQFDNNFSQYAKYIKDNALYLKEKKEMASYILE